MPNFKYDMDEWKQEIYVLKHKDLDVALVHVNTTTGTIEYILEVYLPDELPVGCLPDGTFIAEWWRERAIPESRRGIMQVLNYLKESTNQSLMLSGYGLGLTDTGAIDFDDKISRFSPSPSSSVNGEMKKSGLSVMEYVI